MNNPAKFHAYGTAEEIRAIVTLHESCNPAMTTLFGNEPTKRQRPPDNFIQPLAAQDSEIWLYDVIGDEFTGITAKRFGEVLRQMKGTKEVTVRINSPGGNVFEGMSIYSLLNTSPAKIRIEVDGLAASAASFIAMAGDTINMAENAMMMIHEARGGAWGTADDLRSYADMVEKANSQIVNLYVQRTGKSEKDIAALLKAETWMTAAEAMDMGFATSMTPAKRVAACFNLNGHGFKHIPEVLTAAKDPEQEKREQWAAEYAEIEALKKLPQPQVVQ